MGECPSCGRENPGDARFCNACGGALEAVVERGLAQRKVVTILFCDVVGSTALGESTDPEALRARMQRYFADLRRVIERHGGTVEKFVGDAVMAVFGIPTSHEDDALRAVRAAWEMRAAISGHGLEARIGVNTGEVVVGGDGETLVTGDAVNVAARFEQAAPPGEALIGAETLMLVRDAVHTEAVQPLALKGKAEPVAAYRLLDLLPAADGLARRLETPLVGRERERRRLWRDFEDAVEEQACRLFTLLGPAGIGKSRLVADFLDRVGDTADVLRCRCLSYGEGITYWPLVEILRAIDVDPDTVIGSAPAETQLAFRRLLEARAAARPQVVVVDDLQWAEPVFVDLVEHVTDLSRGAPIFVLCIARTELLDARPGWGGGRLNATSVLIEPLGSDECAALADSLALDGTLDDELRDRIVAASAGNPLYVEEMLAMVRDRGDGQVVVPPTIQALLQARIDALDGDVRVVMERGAVEGEVFHRGAVAELSPAALREGVETHLATLVRKELIRSTSPTFPDDEGFRFRHLLIRDAAYESLPKATRAELHERFADWLSVHPLVEVDEIVGYHLEQAHRYRAELDPDDPALGDLARTAASRLAAGAEGALARGDWSAAGKLQHRAHALLPEQDPFRAAIAVERAYTLEAAGEIAEAKALVAEALASDDPVIGARAAVAEALLRSVSEGQEWTVADEVHAVLDAAGDDLGLARYWYLVGQRGLATCRAADLISASRQGLSHAQAAGAPGLAHELARLGLLGLHLGPTPVSEVIEIAERLLDEAGGSPLRAAYVLAALGAARAMEGRIDEGLEMVRRTGEIVRDGGQGVLAAAFSMRTAFVVRRAGDFDEEERVLAEGLAELERLGDLVYPGTIALELAVCRYRRADYEGAKALCDVAASTTLPGDTADVIYLAALEGGLLAHEGRVEEGEAAARRGLALSETTDFFQMRGHARAFLAEVLALAGKRAEAASTAAEALAVHDAKGDVTGSAMLRREFGSMGIG